MWIGEIEYLFCLRINRVVMTDHIHTTVVINFCINLENPWKIIFYILPVGERSRFMGGILYRFVHFACTATRFVCAIWVRELSGNICSRFQTNLIPKDRLRLKNLIFSLSNIACYLYYLKAYCRIREIPPYFYLQAVLRKRRLHVTSLPCILLDPILFLISISFC